MESAGTAPAAGLLGGDQQVVMRLAAGLDVHLHLGMPNSDALGQVVEHGSVGACQYRHRVVRL